MSSEEEISSLPETSTDASQPLHSTPIPPQKADESSVSSTKEEDNSEIFLTESKDGSVTAETRSKSERSDDRDLPLTPWHLWLLKKEREAVTAEERKASPGRIERADDDAIGRRKKLLALEEWMRRKDEEQKREARTLEDKAKEKGERERVVARQKEETARRNFRVWCQQKQREEEARKKAEDGEERLKREKYLARKEENEAAYKKWLLTSKDRQTVLPKKRFRSQKTLLKITLCKDQATIHIQSVKIHNV